MDEDLAGMSREQLTDPVPTVPEWPEFLSGCVRYRGAALLLLLGCAHWEPYPIPSPGGPSPRFPSSLRVTTSAGAPAVVVEPFVRGDTLYGTSLGDTVAVSLQTIQALERQRLDGGRTLVTVLGGLAAWITLGLVGGGLE